ncbi:unnamed protein product [Adineta ricciae]|uniref:Uncharacterized protein n=1 Tax=Adineta ricciae TaxID=249248 RepID=A0A814YFI4_ADIRI|nr:unnamed protein product [Adineta ricciae]CAF1228304.1 unnamed protein product [Adineta ricciae]
MPGQTKVIIVTANEDLIRQIAFNTSLKAHVIDLDNKQQPPSTTTTPAPTTTTMDPKDINMAILAKLFQPNLNDDQLFRDALDLPQPKKAKTANQTRKKSVDLVCVICGDRAIGFNYDAPTCNSCKAFFRRNAHEPANKIRCLTGRDDCHIDHEMRRKCTSCRLKKCLQMGMRRDFVLTEEQRKERRKKLEENILLATNNSTPVQSSSSSEEPMNEVEEILMNTNDNNDNVFCDEINETVFGTLSTSDWLTTQSVQASFVACLGVFPQQCVDIIDFTSDFSAVVSYSRFIDECALRFINFFRQIEDFENLHSDDRFVLIKYNVFTIFVLGKCYSYRATNDCCADDNCDASRKSREFLKLIDPSETIYRTFGRMVRSLVQITDQDPVFLSLLSIILLFSRGLSISNEEPLLNDPDTVNQIQLRYTNILWNHLVSKHGEMRAQKQFIDLLPALFELQQSVKASREIFYNQSLIWNNIDQLAPLFQTVLHLS